MSALNTPFYLMIILIMFVSAVAAPSIFCRKHPHFTLLSANEQKWTAGIPSGGSGTEYYFCIKLLTSRTIVFDSVWIGDQVFPSFVTRQKASITGESFLYQKGDTVLVRVSALKNRTHKEATSTPLIKCKGAALIGYLINGRRKYACVEKMIQKQSFNLP